MKSAINMVKSLKNDLRGKTGKQTTMLYSSQIIAMVLFVIIGIINTRMLGPVDYGILAFFLAITSFTVLFFRFGLFSSIGLLLAQVKDKIKERELIGASIILAFFIGISYSIFILILSFFIDNIFTTNIGWILRITSFILIGLPFTLLVPQIGKGTNKIWPIALFNIFPKTVYIIGILLLIQIIQVEVFYFILLHVASIGLGVIVVMNAFRPLFRNIRVNFDKIWAKNKEYGIHLYAGQIANQSTYHLDGVFITFFRNTTQVGFYTLAMTITAPMVALSQALSTSMFKKFVNMNRIPKKIIYYNSLWLAFCVVGLILFGRFIVITLFTDDFLPAVPLIFPLAIAAFFQGMYQPYSFLSAKGKGKWLRNVAYAEMTSNILGNIFLIYFYGAFGAAVSSAISKFLHWAILRHYYGRFIRESI